MEAGKHYHLYTHANGSEDMFRTDENFRYFLQQYQKYIPPVAETLAYCLMPNHLHLLVHINSEAKLTEYFKTKHPTKDLTGLAGESNKDLSGLERFTILQFSHLFNAYTKAYNKMYNRMGSLFVRAFKRKEIVSDAYLTTAIHYIHTNPVHHGFVKTINDWSWSSYGTIITGEPSFINSNAVLKWFGNTDQFKHFHNQPVNVRQKKEIENIIHTP
jgi:putative transposase